MAICRYFLNGWCKFGNNCRFEHPPTASVPSAQVPQVQVRNAPANHDIWDCMRDAAMQVTVFERGGIWPLSCYGPFTGRGSVPGLEDTSPEELRWLYYQCVATGQQEQYVRTLQALQARAKVAKHRLREPNKETVRLIEEVLNSKPYQNWGSSVCVQERSFDFNQQSSGGNSQNVVYSQSTFFSGNNTQSIFGGSNQTLTSSHQSIFGGSNSNNPSQSIFGGFTNVSPPAQNTRAETNPQQKIFAAEIAPQQSIFTSETKPQHSIFGSSNQSAVPSATNIFGGNTNNQQQNIFATPAVPQSHGSSNVFHTQPSIFGGANLSSPNIFGGAVSVSETRVSTTDHSLFYTPMELLLDDEKAAFEAPEFVFGKIPSKPPSKEFCFHSVY